MAGAWLRVALPVWLWMVAATRVEAFFQQLKCGGGFGAVPSSCSAGHRAAWRHENEAARVATSAALRGSVGTVVSRHALTQLQSFSLSMPLLPMM